MALINGKIPPHTECPWKLSCQARMFHHCHHMGKKHEVEFSCAFARGFNAVDKIRGRSRPIQQHLEI